jgi:uncharacterized iron-regulated protein
MKRVRLLIFATLCIWSAGCAMPQRVDLTTRTGGSAFLFNQFQAFDGNTGRPLCFKDLIQRCRRADVILFGEQHGNAVCNQLEAQLLYALLRTDRPLALAMEFFETDTQPPLDAYLTGRLDEPDFIEVSKRPSSYLGTHRPLIELCRAARVPVIAANAPRRLVSAYRKSGLSYDEYRTDLDPEERQWLPVANEYLAGDYRDRFADIMQGHTPGMPPASQPATQPTEMPPASQPSPEMAEPPTSQPVSRPASETPGEPPASMPAEMRTEMPASMPAGMPGTMPVTMPASMPRTMPGGMPGRMPALPSWQELYKAQLLWDEAMAGSIASFRDRFPRHRVMLVVGGFHVAHNGGTAQKLQRRRPDDKLLTIIYCDNPSGQFTFDEEDRGAGDIVIYGLTPPEPERPTMPTPPAKPETPPAETQPAETQPASGPMSMPASAPAETPPTASAPT